MENFKEPIINRTCILLHNYRSYTVIICDIFFQNPMPCEVHSITGSIACRTLKNEYQLHGEQTDKYLIFRRLNTVACPLVKVYAIIHNVIT